MSGTLSRRCRLMQTRYGDDKGACENIFSYGFLEDSVKTARSMFLGLDIPDDDPLRPAKIAVTTAAPGFRLFELGDLVSWESDFVWLVAINEEDGLDFKLRQTVDGEREIQAFWKEAELDDTSKLRILLEQDPMWDVYQLRAAFLLQGRIDRQIHMIREVGQPERGPSVREGPWLLSQRLRRLEYEMLERAVVALEDQVIIRLSSFPIPQAMILQVLWQDSPHYYQPSCIIDTSANTQPNAESNTASIRSRAAVSRSQ